MLWLETEEGVFLKEQFISSEVSFSQPDNRFLYKYILDMMTVRLERQWVDHLGKNNTP